MPILLYSKKIDRCRNTIIPKEKIMESRIINPWTWQDQFGFVQAHEVQAGQCVLYCAGQLSTDADGRPIHAGDMAAQIRQALDNVEQVLQASGYTFANVVRLNYYTTDVDQMLANWGVLVERLSTRGCRCTSTLLGVSRLAYPEMMIEIEATAMK
jgi:enamine deaminase RidA (YjgF/YER057c/UK114 family)